MNQSRRQVVVIGGGAAGFFASITCAQTHPQTQVTLLEAGRQVLSKVRISGGGRCNVTHACFEPALLVQNYPRGGKALRGAFARFQPKDMVAWLNRHGVRLKTEADGRMFPVTDTSETIVQCLIQAAQAAGVRIQTGAAVTQVTQTPITQTVVTQTVETETLPHQECQVQSLVSPWAERQFVVQLKNGSTYSADRLLLATGSSPQGYAIARGLGHTVVPPVPSLFTLQIQDDRLQDLAGIAVDPVQVHLSLPHLEQTSATKAKKAINQTGALLITHWGMSGPAVLKLSAWEARVLHDCHYQASLVVNWLPGLSYQAVQDHLLATKTQYAKRTIAAHCPFALPRRLWERLTASAAIPVHQRWAELANAQRHRLLQELTQGRYPISGKGTFKEEFVTCGGVALAEVNFKTMESRCCPGLYLAGEILDIDGITGGFNFQSAWTTGWLAGQVLGL